MVSSPCSTSHLRSWGVRSHFKRRGRRKWKQWNRAFGMQELASEACGVLGAGLSKERTMLPNTTERSCFTGGTPHLIFYLCCLQIMVAGNLKTAICVCYLSSLYASTWSKAYSLLNFQLGRDWDTIWWGGASKSDWHTFLYLVIYCFQAPFLKWNGVFWVNFNAGFKAGLRSRTELITSLDLCANHFDVLRFVDVIHSRPRVLAP